MINPERTKAPAFSQIENVQFYAPEKRILPNGIPVYVFNEGSADLIKIEMVFKAGNWYQSRPLVATAANAMLVEGTNKRSSKQIAEEIDFYGAYLGTDLDKDFASISLYSLSKYLDKTLPVVEDIIKNASFPEHEFQVYRQNQKQQFMISTGKVATIARMRFVENIFGKKHPYGINPELEDYDTLTRDDVASFYNKMFHSDNCMIIIAGKISSGHMQLIEQYFGKEQWGSCALIPNLNFNVEQIAAERKLFPKENAVQSALRIGRRMFNRSHPDYQKMQVVMTILGGYFGSRLMTNIREDKGYTYGIGASLLSLKNDGYLFVSSEVGIDVREAAIREIYYEMECLKNELVGKEELNLVKNYMLGSLLRSIDGVFSYADRYKTILLNDLSDDYYSSFVQTIRNINALEIKDLASLYLDKNKMIEIIAG